ncbi:dipicolinate synthase subunit B [bacterium]|nr:dipicolinate synthase subunit B [bacterium]
MKNKKIGFCITGSFCTFERILPELKKICEGNEVFPIMSYNAATTDTRFSKAEDFFNKVWEIAGKKPIISIAQAEVFGPKNKMDLIIVAPCTGNTLAKLNHGITDTPVLMACKAHLRNNLPLLIAVSTNDGLSANGKNIGELLNKKNIYFVPFSQDDCIGKTNSLVANYALLLEAANEALLGKQLQPVLSKE